MVCVPPRGVLQTMVDSDSPPTGTPSPVSMPMRLAGIALPARWTGNAHGVHAGIVVGRVGMAIFAVGWLAFDALGNVSHRGFATVLWPLAFGVLGAYLLQRYLLGVQAAE